MDLRLFEKFRPFYLTRKCITLSRKARKYFKNLKFSNEIKYSYINLLGSEFLNVSNIRQAFISWASKLGGDICEDWQHDNYDECIED